MVGRYFRWGYISMRPAGIYKIHDLVTYIMVHWHRTWARLSRLIFGQDRISTPIYGRKLIFYMRIYLYETSRNIQEPWPRDLYFTVLWLQTLTRLSRLMFVQDRISRPINGSKLIFHIRINLYETSRNIQEPWPPDLYFTLLTSDFGRFSMVNIFVIGRFFSSTDGSKLMFY